MTVQTTPKWGLSYYQATDPPAGHAQQQQLAQDLENKALPLAGTLAARPTAAAAGADRLYRATDLGRVYISDGTNWLEVAVGTGVGAQPGDLKATARSSATDGWLMCDGAVVSRTTFAALFAAVSTTYNLGGEPGTDFRLPDLRGRVPVGVDGAAGRLDALDALGNGGGAQRHTLTTSEMPSHRHRHLSGGSTAVTVVNGGLHSATQPGTAFYADTTSEGNSLIENTGGGAAHSNMQPYQVVNWMIKT